MKQVPGMSPMALDSAGPAMHQINRLADIKGWCVLRDQGKSTTDLVIIFDSQWRMVGETFVFID
jgi:hypothetical protein